MSISFQKSPFAYRHHGMSAADHQHMLETIKAKDLEQLIAETIPDGIRLKSDLAIPSALTEEEFLAEFRKIAQKNKVYTSYIGQGYYDTFLPAVIQRNILENPAWYTAYTPYQAEIAQGRMEALINFQTMVSDLTGMELANASLLDEATAAAEAMTMLYGQRKGSKKKTANTFYVSDKVYPQTLDVLYTRSAPLGIRVEVGELAKLDVTRDDVFGILFQYPEADGQVVNYEALVQACNEHQVFVVAAADLLSLTLLTPPGEMGADVVVGTTQRFGVPMGYGGPHAAYFATKEAFKRQIPGRIIGVTQDKEGRPAYRMALQTREQHIRREKATSNICTAQVLLAVIAGMYGVYHGPDGLKHIASRIHGFTALTKKLLESLDVEVQTTEYFDTVSFRMERSLLEPVATKLEVNFYYPTDDTVRLSWDEAKDLDDLKLLQQIFEEVTGKQSDLNFSVEMDKLEMQLPSSILRDSEFMSHEVFHAYRTEHEMLRYMKRLESKDLSLVHSMISLGSCTMKLNATSEMIPLSWPEFAHIHPFAPLEQAQGYAHMFKELEAWLADITGFDAISFQPNSGAQGEYAGLMTIRAYHEHRGDSHRNVALIPASAHGTNPASAVMAGMDVVVVETDKHGNISSEDLEAKVEQYSDRLAALMITYPSTHGVFEHKVKDFCALIHQHGGQVYMDGANMNAQVGLTSPGLIGADVCHLNLHKTFCIPHGGGGPGMGPIGVAEHLTPFLSTHSQVPTGGTFGASPVSAAPFGSASILTISYAYIRMMGGDGLTEATRRAILNANYIKERLETHYSILYTGLSGRSAHEFIIDLRPFKQSAGIEATDLAKRLMDYGYHAPTMSFPVPGTLMIEPTESESLAELDRFCEAMMAIRAEIKSVEEGEWPVEDNPLKNAPHTMRVLTQEKWEKTYSREQAVFPIAELRWNKFWPSVSRVDDAYGDRNLVCSCLPIEAYTS
ncbi:MAG: glycine dehydrogenase (aminomethyl-transferring) [Rhodothermaeota bacterium MED-G12]|nr:MAG: glycine dehydrogenase (aminomethyl-transferring) [Rhodothermaeota bacterium MED-G12]